MEGISGIGIEDIVFVQGMNIFCEGIYVKCEPDGLRFFLVWICSILDAKEGMRRYFMNGLKCEKIYLVDAMVSVLILGGLSPFFVNVLDELGLNFMGCFLVFGFCFHFLGFCFVVLVHEKSDFWNQFFVVLFCCLFFVGGGDVDGGGQGITSNPKKEWYNQNHFSHISQ